MAVVGPTGSGKSTLLMLVSGVYAPWSGEILFDGVPRKDIPRDILTSSVAIVDQQPFLFAGTVRDNLTMWNPTVPDDQLIAASRDALIHSDIMSRSAGYDSAVQEGWSQLQRRPASAHGNWARLDQQSVGVAPSTRRPARSMP